MSACEKAVTELKYILDTYKRMQASGKTLTPKQLTDANRSIGLWRAEKTKAETEMLKIVHSDTLPMSDRYEWVLWGREMCLTDEEKRRLEE